MTALALMFAYDAVRALARRRGPRYTLDHAFPDGTPRRLAGTWRPTLEQAVAEEKAKCNWIIEWGYPVPSESYAEKWWKEGRYDRPLYHAR